MSRSTVDDPVVTIVVVSYNTRDMTLECLASIARETATAHEVIVVDNDSTDGSAAAIAEGYPEVRLLAETENHGFAQANNLAARLARGRYLLLLNPDTVVLDRAIDRLVQYAERTPGARIWGGVTRFGDGSLNRSNCWRQMTVASTLWRVTSLDRRFPHHAVFNAEAYGDWDRTGDRAVDIVSGCFFLIERTLWEELGGFDPAFVMYGEEADLCLRARRYAAAPSVTSAAQIVHYGGASEAVRSGKHVRLLSAKITLADRHMAGWRRAATVSLLRSWPLTRAMAAGLHARLTPSPARKDTFRNWREVWRARDAWWNGYPSRPAPAQTVTI